MLTTEQAARLKSAVRKPPAYTRENTELEEVIEALKKENPEAFHSADTLKTRRFIVPPKQNIPYDRLF